MPSLPPPVQTPPSETIYLVGSNGHPNFGDEFIAAAWLRFLARTRPDADVWLDCRHPGTASHLFAGLHPRLRTTDTLWQVVADTADLAAPEADARVDKLVTELGSPRYDTQLLDAREAATIHFLGGGYLNSRWSANTRLLRAAIRLQEISGTRLLATGLGVTPADETSDPTQYLRGFDHATVRDRPSAELTGLEQVVDDSLLGHRDLPAIRQWTPPDPDEPGEVWVCLQSDVTDEATFEAAVEAVREALSSDQLSGRPAFYVESIPGWDRVAFDRLDGLIPEENFVPFTELVRRGFPGKAGQTWLTSRMHFHLLAAACGATGTALEISTDYYRTKHQSLVEIGTGWSVTPAGEKTIVPPSGNAAFASQATSLAAAKLNEAQALYPV